MSTFGKKSLVWWDYHDKSRDNIRRYRSTPRELQKEIIEKWYPIGMRVQEYSFGKVWTILGYKETNLGWCLDVINEDGYTDNKTPLVAYPIKEDEIKLKRDIKLEKLFK